MEMCLAKGDSRFLGNVCIYIYQTTGPYLPQEQNSSDQKYICMCMNMCQKSGSQNIKQNPELSRDWFRLVLNSDIQTQLYELQSYIRLGEYY